MASADRVTANIRAFFVCSHGDLPSGDPERLLGLASGQKQFVCRVVLPCHAQPCIHKLNLQQYLAARSGSLPCGIRVRAATLAQDDLVARAGFDGSRAMTSCQLLHPRSRCFLTRAVIAPVYPFV